MNEIVARAEPYTDTITWNDLVELYANGWEREGSWWDEERQQFFVQVRPPAGWSPDGPVLTRPGGLAETQPGQLAVILDDLLFAAGIEPGITQRWELGGGLLLEIALEGRKIWLRLSRRFHWPAESDFQTLLFYWPQNLPTNVPVIRSQDRDRFYLSASWAAAKG